MRTVRFTAFLGIALLVVAACAPASQPASPTQAPSAPKTETKAEAKAEPKAEAKAPAKDAGNLRTVSVATQLAGQSGYLATLIEEKGIAAKHGLKIENLSMDFTETANALKLGRAQAGAMQPSTALNLKKSGTELKLLAPSVWSGNAWVVRKDAPYQSFKDLKGKKIGNFSRVTGAYFYSAVIAKQDGLDIEKDFESVQAETAALLALLERNEVEAINMFEPHTSRLLVSGQYRVLTDFDKVLGEIFGTAPLKTGLAVTKEAAEKDPQLAKTLQAIYMEGVQVIKSKQDEQYFRENAKKFFGLNTPEEIDAAIQRNRDNFADKWGDDFFAGQNKILQKGVELTLLPDVGDLNQMWFN